MPQIKVWLSEYFFTVLTSAQMGTTQLNHTLSKAFVYG